MFRMIINTPKETFIESVNCIQLIEVLSIH